MSNSAQTNKSDILYSLWDCGGQKVFYQLHHLFLMMQGIYLLCFDMKKLISAETQQEELETMEFWLNSVALHVPGAPLILVGTRLDEMDPEQLDTVNNLIYEVFSKRFKYSKNENGAFFVGPDGEELWFEFNEQQGLYFFPIDNHDESVDDRALSLRKKLESMASNDSRMNFLDTKVSVRWIHLLDSMLNDQDRMYFDLREVIERGSKVHMEEVEVQEMLHFFNRIGVLIHLTATDALNKIVITQPQWLLDKLTVIIRDEIHDADAQKKDCEQHRLGPAYDMLRNEGIASKKLLCHLWKDEQVDFLKDMMMNALLACALDNDKLLIPSLLTTRMIEFPFPDFDVGFGWLAFEYLPDGLFQRFVCYLLNQPKTKPKENYKNYAEIVHMSATVLLFVVGSKICFQFRTKDDEKRLPVVVKSLLEHLDDVDRAFMNSSIEWSLVLSTSNSLIANETSASYENVVEARENGAPLVYANDGQTELELSAFSIFGMDILDDRNLVEQDNKLTKKQDFHAFLSHDWGKGLKNHRHIVKIKEALVKRGLKIWLDQDQVSESVANSMIRGIDSSHVVVVFVSQNYMEKVNRADPNDNCFVEYNYAIKTKKKVLPVVVEQHLKSLNNWKGLLLGQISDQTFYTCVHEEPNFEKSIDGIANAIKTMVEN